MTTYFHCDAILFDLDGVLVDSTETVERNWREWAKRQNLDADDVLQVAHGRRTVDVIRLLAPHLVAEEEAARQSAAEADDTRGVYRIDGAAELLRDLPAGAWAIVTSGGHRTATARISYLGLPRPEVLVTADDVTEGKPHPTPYLTAADQLGIAAEACLVIEDAPAGIDAARAAGMQVVAVTTTYPAEALHLADAIAGKLTEIVIQPAQPDVGRRLVVQVTNSTGGTDR